VCVCVCVRATRARAMVPQKTMLDVKKWELKKGFGGILCKNTVRRLCEACDCRPTRTLEEPVCATCCTTKRRVPVANVKMCTMPSCHRAAHHAKGTLCAVCWVEEDPVTRGCPGCERRPKSLSRSDRLCQDCTRRIDRGGVPVKRETCGVSDLFL